MPILGHQLSVITRGGCTGRLMKLNAQGPFQGPVPNCVFIVLFLEEGFSNSSSFYPFKIWIHLWSRHNTRRTVTLSCCHIKPALLLESAAPQAQRPPFSGHASVHTRGSAQPHCAWSTISEGQEEARTWSCKSIKQTMGGKKQDMKNQL